MVCLKDRAKGFLGGLDRVMGERNKGKYKGIWPKLELPFIELRKTGREDFEERSKVECGTCFIFLLW